MKIRITFFGSMLTIVSILVLNMNTKLIANSSGSVGGYSSSVGSNGNSCGQGGCHGGGQIIDNSGYIVTDIPGNGYVPGNTYTIQVMGASRGRSKFGFELSAENGLGAKLGVFTAGTNREQVKSNGNVTHTSSGNNLSNGGFGWQTTWTAPTSGSGSVTFNASVLFANGNNSNSGDSTRVASITVPEQSALYVKEIESEIKSLYPNPVVDELIINLKNPNSGLISVYTTSGKVIKNISTTTMENKIDCSDLPKGTYVISIVRDGMKHSKIFVKQ